MSDKKIIIRNCPCIIEFKNMHFCAELNNIDEFKQLCSDCTDCVMKQIVKKCKLFQNNYLVNDGVQLLTTNILNSLDIQEAE